MIEKKAITDHQIDSLIEKRWSPRAFDKDKKVEREKVLSLCEAARWAPSCFNEQPWRFIVFDSEHDNDTFQKALGCLVEWNQKWAKNCSVLIAAMAHTKFKKNDEANDWASYDTGAAAENICLQATSSGLMAHQMGGFDKDKLIETFEIPDEITPIAMIAVGYQSENPESIEEFGEMDKSKRERNELGKNFFDGSLKKGIK